VAHRASTLREYYAVTDAVNSYISDHYAEDITLDTFCTAHMWSRRHVQRVLKEADAGGWRDRLSRHRMDVAAQLLLGTTYTVREISQMVGYHQPAQFAKAFKRHYNMQPREYRRSLAGQVYYNE
jgi:AraC family transcriptional regulator of adaptative response / methylphosphotriester-DNA alkyltransferase methyltransferase